MLKARVGSADETEGNGAKPLLAGLDAAFPRLAKLWVDGGYKRRFAAWVEAELGWAVEEVRHPGPGKRRVWVADGQEPPEAPPAGFRVLPRRWVVERTFAWLGRNRRLSKDYEKRPDTEEAWTYLGMIRLMAARLAR